MFRTAPVAVSRSLLYRSGPLAYGQITRESRPYDRPYVWTSVERKAADGAFAGECMPSVSRTIYYLEKSEGFGEPIPNGLVVPINTLNV